MSRTDTDRLYVRIIKQGRAERGKCWDCRNDAVSGRRCRGCAERHRNRSKEQTNMALRDLPLGTRYGQLTLIAHLPTPKYGAKDAHARWRCDCGKEKRIRMTAVSAGYARSCGCVSQRAMRGLAMAHSNEVMR